MFAAVVGVLLIRLFAQTRALHHASAAQGAGARHFNDERLGEGALRIARAGEKTSKASAFDDHAAPADVALFLAHLIGHLEIDALKVAFGFLERSVKAAVKIVQHRLPRHLALFDRIKCFFHARGKFGVDDIGEFILHQSRHHLAERRGAKVLALLDHIFAVKNGGNGGRIGGGASDAVLLHGADQGRVRIAGGRLGKVLLRLKFPELHLLPLIQRRQKVNLFFLLVVARLLIYRRIAGKLEAAGAGMELMLLCRDLNAHTVVDGVSHLAGKKTAPDQAVEAVLLTGKVVLDPLRRQFDVGGTDRFVRVLRTLFGLKAARGGRIIVLAVAAENKRPGGAERFLAQAQGVGTHVGDQAHRALAADINALIELLGDRHGAARRHIELAGSLLLERGGRERRRGGTLLVRALDAFDGKHRVSDLRHDGIDLLRRGRLLLFPVFTVVMGKKFLLRRRIEKLCVQSPVFFRRKGSDLLFTVIDHARGDRLHTAGAQTPSDLFPQQRRELVAHDPVEDTARLLRVHKVLVDRTRLPDALRDDFFGDLIERHALGLVVAEPQKRL